MGESSIPFHQEPIDSLRLDLLIRLPQTSSCGTDLAQRSTNSPLRQRSIRLLVEIGITVFFCFLILASPEIKMHLKVRRKPSDTSLPILLSELRMGVEQLL